MKHRRRAYYSIALLGILSALSGCGEASPDEERTYTALEGVYAIHGVERYPGACDATGPSTPVAAPPYWVAYVVRAGVPNVQLHAAGCTELEACRALAADLKADGKLDTRSYYQLMHATYSRVNASGDVDGVGIAAHPVGLDCALDLRQFAIEQRTPETDFLVTTREGARYSAGASGECAARPDLEANWAEWQDNACLQFQVIRTEFVEALR